MPYLLTKTEIKSRIIAKKYMVDKDELQKMYVLRRILNPMGTMDSIEFLLGKLKETKDNADFFQSMNK